MDDRTERWIRRNLRTAARMGGVESADAVGLILGTLAALHRSGGALDEGTRDRWAVEEGWDEAALPVLRGIALAAEVALPDLGELTTTRAADGSLVVHLTRDEARAAHGALREVLLGPHAIPEWEFHPLMGFRPDAARVVFDALGAALKGA
jgi:hypothetical protein